MLNVDNIIFYNEPETLADAKAQASNQKPYKPTYATEAYVASIGQSKDWILNPDHYDADFKPNDVNLTDRVDKGIEEILSGKTSITGESNWFNNVLSKDAIIGCITTNCSVAGCGSYGKGTTVTLTVTLDNSLCKLDALSWSGLPVGATISADYTTATFVASENITCSCYATAPLTLTPTGTCTIKLNTVTSGDDIQYSKDWGVSWNYLTNSDTSFTDVMILKGNATTWNYTKRFVITGSVAVSGRLTDLFDGGAATTTSLGQSACDAMFYGCTTITSAPDMSRITTLGESACSEMFNGCSNLITAPDLSNVTTVGNSGCNLMFKNCSKLTGPVYVPKISPSETLTKDMFRNAGTSHKSSAVDNSATIVAPTSTVDWNYANAGVNSSNWVVKEKL